MTQILRVSILELSVGFATGDLSLLIPGLIFVEVQLDLPCFLNCLSGSNCWPLLQTTLRLSYHMFKPLPHISEKQGNFGILQKTKDLQIYRVQMLSFQCTFNKTPWMHEAFREMPYPNCRTCKIDSFVLLLMLSDSLIILCVLSLLIVSDSSQPHGLQPARLLFPWNFPGKNTGVLPCLTPKWIDF